MENSTIVETFHQLEKECIGFDNDVNCDDEHYMKTLEGLRKLVSQIQSESLFSPNEEIKEIETDHVKLLMAPYYEAEVLFRIMDNREERVKMAHVFYLEYLRMLDHYGVLDKDQQKVWKRWMDTHKVAAMKTRTDMASDEVKELEALMKELAVTKSNPYESREAKIAEFKMKKAIDTQLDMLKNYSDEEMKRDFYMAQIKRSIIGSFEQLRLVEMELEILKHRGTLTPEQIEANEQRSRKPEPGSLPPLQYKTITKDSLNKIPYLMRPQNEEEDLNQQEIVQSYKDPQQRMVVQKETIDARVNLRDQYAQQVFRPGHNMPTKTLEQLAEEEMRDAMQRQAQDEEMERQRAEEDPDDEEVLERERQKTMQHENWKDYVPKGRGITKKI